MEDLTKEISLCLRYYSVTFRGQRPSRVRLMGGEAHDPQLVTMLSGALSISVEAGAPLFSLNCAQIPNLDAPRPPPNGRSPPGSVSSAPKENSPRATARLAPPRASPAQPKSSI